MSSQVLFNADLHQYGTETTAPATCIEVDAPGPWQCAVSLICDGNHDASGGLQGASSSCSSLTGTKERPFRIADDLYCAECIEDFFEQACDLNGGAYPPKVQRERLNIDTFAHRLSAGVVNKFRRLDALVKSTNTYERVTCHWPSTAADTPTGELCNEFVCKQLPTTAEDIRVQCPKCHECPPETVTLQKLLQSEERSREHQVCPQCGELMYLKAGCNRITCKRCDSEFCYICGQEADGLSDHWVAGGCPRWNPPNPEADGPQPQWDNAQDIRQHQQEIQLDREIDARICLVVEPEDHLVVDFAILQPGPSRWRKVAQRLGPILTNAILNGDRSDLFAWFIMLQMTLSADRLTHSLHNDAVAADEEDLEIRFLRNLYLTHHAAKFRQTWNILLWQFPDMYGPEWEHFERFEHLRKLTLWATLHWNVPPTALPVADWISFDLATIESVLIELRDKFADWLVEADDDPPEALNWRTTARLAQCLSSLVTTLRLCERRTPPELLVLERMNVKYLYEELLDIYMDEVVGIVGLEDFEESGQDQQMLCMIIEVMFERTISLGEDANGNTYSEDQAHIMSGRLYFSEISKVIEYLKPDDPHPDEWPDEPTEEQLEARKRLRAIDALRRAVGLLLQYANGDPDGFDQTTEFTELDETMLELGQASELLDPAVPITMLIMPVLTHVINVANSIMGDDEVSETDSDAS
ncbi:hypothetical protein M409DRAFT_61249 [Zasmidium cellare ATCC 36951]|uniref:IBR domain-containing protein n=1 Tax=Zasmidium cellare ATCC 36951 TaxID=1080233 RepID=A0A6A6BWE2_ZASCE|nr:uncharacterized protein M409DRAFT_61249 [Zasmidium cellare ATCC 36951]KAF2158903.1 hypothetical protein M409DRAFT_61249 [Zasmidium cellare ATCC 36951]